MTAEEAARVFAEIAVRTNGWDEASSEAWMRDIGRLHHPDLAAHAARQLVDNHDGYSRPPWGAYLTNYRTLCARRIDDDRALPAARHEHLTLPAYLDRLKARSEAGMCSLGDPTVTAAEELANWRRLAHADAPSLIPTTWQQTLAEEDL